MPRVFKASVTLLFPTRLARTRCLLRVPTFGAGYRQQQYVDNAGRRGSRAGKREEIQYTK